MKPNDHLEKSAEQIQFEIYSKMSFAKKWDEAVKLREIAWRLKAARIQQQHPDWDVEKVETEVKKVFLYAVT